MHEDYSNRNAVYGEHTGEYIDIQGLRIHVMVAGEGDPVLLIHGIGQSAYTWRKNIAELSKHFCVIAVDMLGHGYSDKPDLTYSIEEYSEFLLALMNTLRIKQAHAIGMGSGGTILLDYMSNYPDRIGRAVCIAPGGPTPEMPAAIRMLRGPAAAIAKGMITERGVKKMMRECFFDQTALRPEDAEEVFMALDSREAKEVLHQSVLNFDETEVIQGLRNIKNSVLLFWGGDDRWRPVEDSRDYTDLLENCELMVIRNCGHLLHEEKADRFNEAVIAFLQGHPAPKE